MSRNRVHIEAPREEVFAVLADADRYPDWVVGAAAVEEQDDEFPAVGSRFHHRVGLRPFALSDHTEVVDVDPPRRIALKAKARPLGTADIVIELDERAGGTDVLMRESPGDRLTAFLAGNRVADTALRLRNAEALSRLKRTVEKRPLGAPLRRRELAGQRVLITGASSGIGLATAQLLAGAGARLVLLARGEDGLAKAKHRLAGAGAEVHVVKADVRDRANLSAAVDQAASDLGGLDVVVTAAVGAAFGPFVETDPEDFDATVATVLGGTANTIRAALPRLEESAGALVCIGSIASQMPLPGLSAYTAAKHGLAGLLDTLRIELAEAGSPLTISLVNPGAVDTPLWDHLESQTGLLPPVPPDSYSPQTVAEAVVSAIRRPREETIVGGSATLQVALFRRLRKLTSRTLTVLSRLAQTGGERTAEPPGGLRQALGGGEIDAGNGGRRSLAVAALRQWDGLLRRIGAA
ncbi:MAG: SDR family NAD(P)-dependent oxidoreductase [Solirubrobacterales bacterium]